MVAQPHKPLSRLPAAVRATCLVSFLLSLGFGFVVFLGGRQSVGYVDVLFLGSLALCLASALPIAAGRVKRIVQREIERVGESRSPRSR
jgi:hypothetical protein